MRPVVVFGTHIREFLENRVLDASYMAKFHGGPVLTHLAAAAGAAGFAFETTDVFSRRRDGSRGVLVSDMGAGVEGHPAGLVPTVCFSLESPLIAYHFYRDLDRFVAPFRHAFLWRGAHERARRSASATTVHELSWPNTRRESIAGPGWDERRLLTLISSNKRGFRFTVPREWPTRPDRFVRRVARVGLEWLRWHTRPYPWLEPDLYEKRVDAIRHFARRDDFDLFGPGWESTDDPALARAIGRCYRGALPPGPDAKLEALSRYKFAICYENTRFPGYVTEKIFDCLFSGCIPIYVGAPDFAESIPRECCIDGGAFASHADLESTLLSLSQRDAGEMLEAGRAFMASQRFDRFHVESFVRSVMNTVGEEATRR